MCVVFHLKMSNALNAWKQSFRVEKVNPIQRKRMENLVFYFSIAWALATECYAIRGIGIGIYYNYK